MIGEHLLKSIICDIFTINKVLQVVLRKGLQSRSVTASLLIYSNKSMEKEIKAYYCSTVQAQKSSHIVETCERFQTRKSPAERDLRERMCGWVQ